MRAFGHWRSRPAALAAVVLGTGVLLLARPTRGQQGPFSVQASVPASASNAPTTEVRYSFPLPSGLVARWNPRVRVTDASGQLVELLPMSIDQRSPAWTGHRGLHTGTYPPGAYLVSIEVDYSQPNASTGSVATPPAVLTVPAR